MARPTPKQIEIANQLPLNQAAIKFLDQTDWGSSGLLEIAAVALMRWGLENGLEPPSGALRATPEQFEDLLNHLADMPPEEATTWLYTSAEDPDDIYSDVVNLAEQDDPEEAAWTLIDAAFCKMEVLM